MIVSVSKCRVTRVLTKRALAAVIAQVLALAAIPAWCERAEAQEGPSQSYSRVLARADRHMVSAANAYAAEAGREMLRAGGSAIDAAIATQLVLNLVEPQSSGIGGGAFILYWDAARKELKAYDGREAAPASAKPDRFLVDGRPMAFTDAVHSGLSMGVPGVVRLLEMVHKQHGKLPWARLFEPAIRRSENGFVVSPRLHDLLQGAHTEDFTP